MVAGSNKLLERSLFKKYGKSRRTRGVSTEKKANKRKNEPEIIVRPLGRLGGLDNIHILLMALVVVLVGVVLVISYSKPQVVFKNQTISCAYGAVNNTCITPIHNITAVKMQAEKILATYGDMNNSLYLLPYITNVSRMNISYLPKDGEWYVVVPAKNPVGNVSFFFSMLLRDSNLSLVTPFLQTVSPSITLSNRVVAQGVVHVSGKLACIGQPSTSVYWLIDTYAPGSIESLSQLVNIEKEFGGKINATVDVLYGPYSQLVASKYNETPVLNLSKDILCASHQQNFASFVHELNSTYTNSFVPQTQLNSIVGGSGFNMSSFDACLANASTLMNRQALLTEYYNITSTPSVIVDCEYLTLPQYVNEAICYANESICR